MDPVMQSIAHSQHIARRQGSNQMAVEVYGWAIIHALEIPAPAFKELMAIIAKEAE